MFLFVYKIKVMGMLLLDVVHRQVLKSTQEHVTERSIK